MNYNTDPYWQAQMNETQANYLNFSSGMKSSNPDAFIFSGNSYSLKVKSQEMNAESLQKYTSLRINVSGTLTKGNDVCCLWATIIVGSILLFPLFFICCDWWKRRINKNFKVEDEGYEAIINLVHNSSVDEFYLMVQDNTFNKMKAEALCDALSRSKIKNFSFTNMALGFDCEGSNFSDFDQYMRPFKSLPMRSDISWGTKVVI